MSASPTVPAGPARDATPPRGGRRRADADAARGSLDRGARHKRRSWLAATVAVASLAGLVALAVTKLDPGVVVHALAHVNPGWIALALVLMGAAFFARAESWYAVLRAAVAGKEIDGVRLELGLDRGCVRRAILIGMLGSTVAPGRLGEPARAWVVARRLGKPACTFAIVVGTVFSQTFLNLLALAILAVVAVLDTALANARLEAIAAATVLPAVLLALISASPPMLRRLGARSRRSIRAAASWAEAQLLRCREGLAVFRQPLPALHATVAQLTAWALQLGACYTTILALRLQNHATLAAAAAVLLAVNLTAIVPVTPSNVGVFQAACIAVLHPFHVDASRALAYGLILQAVEIFAALVLGAPALLKEGLHWSDLRHRARGGADRVQFAPSTATAGHERLAGGRD